MRFLLDVNLLMALLWENHEHNQQARRWFKSIGAFSTCPITQIGFVRISTHANLGYSEPPERAFGVLRRFIADPRHLFVHDDLSCEDRILFSERILGPQM
ncbi:MAG TPA: hypothetical protein VG733_05545 [Chthoniobacteraceae bacterium]|nr:hypothetical protein [Chthoniobacteraceae bacterium]